MVQLFELVGFQELEGGEHRPQEYRRRDGGPDSTRASGEDDQVSAPSGVGMAEAREAPGPRKGGRSRTAAPPRGASWIVSYLR